MTVDIKSCFLKMKLVIISASGVTLFPFELTLLFLIIKHCHFFLVLSKNFNLNFWCFSEN